MVNYFVRIELFKSSIVYPDVKNVIP